MEFVDSKNNDQIKLRLKNYLLENRDALDELLKSRRKDSPKSQRLGTEEKSKETVFEDGEASSKTIDFSVIFFSDASNSNVENRYEFLVNMAKYADRNGYKAVWLPERHFHSFGGNFSSPAVLFGMLSGMTDTIRLRAGSVVLPLEHPARVVEQWSVLDNLSGGRVDLGLASGWNPNDFVLSPDTFGDLRNVWKNRIPLVKALWGGEKVSFRNGKGEKASIETFPKPIQKELNVWLTATEKNETFIEAGSKGYNILTMLKGIGLSELKPKIDLYRQAREQAGYDPKTGVVTLMLHTFVNPDEEYVKNNVAAPFKKYIESAISGHVQILDEDNRPSKEEVEALVEYSYERYYKTAALFGSPDHCKSVVDEAIEIGVNEIACLQDFGVDSTLVMDSLSHLTELKNQYTNVKPKPLLQSEAHPKSQPEQKVVGANNERENNEREYNKRAEEAVAIVGMSCHFPGSKNKNEYWNNLLEGKELLSDIPETRWNWEEHFGDPTMDGNKCKVKRAGFIDDAIMGAFAPELFGLNPKEASVIDPHQKLFLQVVWSCLEDAGYAGKIDDISNTGVFAAMYNLDHAGKKLDLNEPVSPYDIAGVAHSIVANRTSYAFNFTGPSEVVDTACSSSLVALHRALNSIRGGECEAALVGGVSLLLSPHRVIALSKLGLLSQESQCKPFDANTTGQVIGEGGGVLMLKPLSKAEQDGDHIYGLIKGSCVNHNGNNSGSLTLPDASSQAKLVLNACDNAKVDYGSVSYIEAHGAGGYGDIIELEAFKRASEMTQSKANQSSCAVGSVKPNIGFLEASGGISQLIKVLLMLDSKMIVPTINNDNIPEEVELGRTRYRLADKVEPWINGNELIPRRAGVHAYGLGGTNAHIILEEYNHSARNHLAEEPMAMYPFCFSGMTKDLLSNTLLLMLEALDVLIKEAEEAGNGEPLADIAYTLATGRKHFSERVVFTARNLGELVTKINNFLQNGDVYEGLEGDIHLSNFGNGRVTKSVLTSWVSGENVDWIAEYGLVGGNKLSLPCSVFTNNEKKSNMLAPNRNISLVQEGFWSVDFSKNDPYIYDHCVDGENIVSAVVYLDVITQLLNVERCFPIQIKDLCWQLPCVVEIEKKKLNVRVSDEGRQLQFFSNFNGIDIEYCSGVVNPSISLSSNTVSDAPLDSDVRHGSKRLTAEDCYQRYIDRGVKLGSTYRGIQSCIIQEREIFSTIAKTSLNGIDNTQVVDPTVLDGLFQSCGILLDETLLTAGSRYLPFSLGEISIFNALDKTDYQGHAKLVRENSRQGLYWFDMTLMCGNECVIRAENFCLKQLPSVNTRNDVFAGVSEEQLPPIKPDKNIGNHHHVLDDFCGLLSKYNTQKWSFGIHVTGSDTTGSIDLRGKVSLDGAKVSYSMETTHEELEILMSYGDLSTLIDGTMDPTVLYLTGRFDVYPKNALSFQRTIGEMLFRHHNQVNLHPSFDNHLIDDIYSTGRVQSQDGEVRHIFPWSIPSSVGSFIYQFVMENNLSRTLEIGMAYGLASLCLCKAHDDRGQGSHISVDPCQTSDFLNIARRNLELARLSSYCECIEEPDFLALPQLYSRNNRFDFVFIDGLHMFDYTLVDFFYSDLLLDVGGYIAFDDSQVPGVARVLDFIKTNRNYEIITAPVERLTLFRKKNDDSRSLLNPNHYEEF